nr:choice-of-anchor J domain-containing protein [Bacteroidales bacterium]
MKRLVLFVMAVMAFAGMSVAQDVYSSGYYKDGSNVYHAAVFKNGAKLWTWSGSSTSAHTSSDVDYYNGDVYWVDNAVSTSDGVFYYGDIVKNGSKYLENASGSGAHIYALERSNLGTALFAIGCKKTGGVKTAWFWNDNVHMDGSGAQLGDGIYESVAYGAADDGSYMCICGYQHTDASTYHGVIWRNGVFHSFDNGTKLYDMAYYNGYLYIVGSAVEGSSTKLKVWETKVSDGTTTVKYTISESMTTSFVDERFSIYMDAGDIYVNGMDSGTDKIWKNGNELYTGGSYFCSVVANTNGVYYAGQYGGGQIWKDGEILYSPTVSSTVNSDRITGLFIAEPTCTNNEARSLPFNETFENGETDWPCWTKIDADNNNGTAVSYWHRAGEGECTSWHGHYCVRHPTSTAAQEGWLISPRLILQPEYNATLTFRSWSNSGVNKSVLVSTGSNPSTTSSYTEVWSNDECQGWSNVEIDLSAYQGQNIYIAFKYNDGNDTWLIDDVDVEETAPSEYTITANANNSDWGTVSGGGSYAAGANCTLHATPATGYQFECWKKNGSGTPESTNPDYSFTVTESATYTAYFAETPVVYYTISTGVLPSGAGSVEGGGTFAEGSSVTLTATAGEGYTFDQWQDGNTDNPRTVEVTGDAVYTAHFTQEEYTVVVFANPTDGGTVGGGGPYHYGETATLTATPASGYEFAGWSDGSNENPHTVTVTGNAVYTATFNPVGSTFYTVSTSAEPEAGGTVTGGGPYEEGTEVQLRAIANPGYTFSHWNDGITSNPRTITVTGDMTFKAIFTQNAYTITVNANPSAGGEVSGGGSYYYGTVVSLRATAYNGYEFAGWSDGSNENPHDITVTGNATYTATFSPVGTTFYTVSASVSPVGAGTVDGAGAYSAGTNITLTAEANEGYTFDHW